MQTIPDLYVFLLFIVEILITAFFIWGLMRMNRQIRRIENAPVPKKLFNILTDQQAATELELHSTKRKADHNAASIDDAMGRIARLNAQSAARIRHEAKFDLAKFAEYVAQLPDENGVTAQVPDNIDVSTGQEIDYR